MNPTNVTRFPLIPQSPHPMPVNTAALKTFAPAMRRQLIEAVGRKLDRLLHQISADTLTTVSYTHLTLPTIYSV